MPTLTDRFGRVHSYLRVSVTDRCNFRCVYCMPAEGLSWMPKDELLSFEEIATIVRAFARLGVTRVRLTGGEPTMRADLEQLVTAIAAVPGIKDIAMTTNGHTLAALAPRLRAAGLRRVNVSLDSLDPKTFGRLTRGGADLLAAKIVQRDRRAVGDPQGAEPGEAVGPLDRSRHERGIGAQRDPRRAGVRAGLVLLAQPLLSPCPFREHDDDLAVA